MNIDFDGADALLLIGDSERSVEHLWSMLRAGDISEAWKELRVYLGGFIEAKASSYVPSHPPVRILINSGGY